MMISLIPLQHRRKGKERRGKFSVFKYYNIWNMHANIVNSVCYKACINVHTRRINIKIPTIIAEKINTCNNEHESKKRYTLVPVDFVLRHRAPNDLECFYCI